PLFRPSVQRSHYDSDGFLTHSGMALSDTIGSYLRVFRNGAVESVNTLPQFGSPIQQKQILALDLDIQVLKILPAYFKLLKAICANPPVVVGLTLTGVAGHSMAIPWPAEANLSGRPIRSDVLFLPEVVAETFECDLGQVLKPMFDAMWRAAGCEGSLFYDGPN